MPIYIEGSGTEPTAYVAPDNGDFVDGASVQQTIQPAVDAISWLKAKTPGARNAFGAGFEMLQPMPTAVFAGSHFTFDPANGWCQTTTGGVFGGAFFYIPLGPFPRNQTDAPLYISEVTVRVKPVGHASLPGSMPGFYLYTSSPIGMLNLGSIALDTSPNVGAYNVAHDINNVLASGFSLDWDPSPTIYVAIFGEYAANAVTGLQVIGVKATLRETP
jgi:hypothetical protein